MRVARDEAERQVFWKMRKAAFPAMGRVSSHYYVQDSRHPAHARWATCSTASTSSRASTTCRWPTSSTPATATCTRSSATTATPRARRERAEELAGEIVVACVEAGGSITGEHGVGVDKKRYMPKMFSEADLDAFQKLRCAFDPDGLANPGKVMPTPRLCGEVPGALPRAPAREGGPGGALLMDAAGVAAALREAARACACVGGGTKLGWGRPIEAPELSLAELDAIVEHNVGDLTAILQAGCPLATAREAFAADGQMLALDPPDDGATIGGVVATGDSGPLRHRYGGPRDLVLGVQVALPDGSLARAGSKVIKNVAGYDLAKLMTGAYGTLGRGRRRSACACTRAPRERADRRRAPRRPARARPRPRASWPTARSRPSAWTCAGRATRGAVLVQLCAARRRAERARRASTARSSRTTSALWAAQRAAQRGPVVAARLDHPAGPRRRCSAAAREHGAVVRRARRARPGLAAPARRPTRELVDARCARGSGAVRAARRPRGAAPRGRPLGDR